MIAVASGWVHGLALKSDRTVWAWGENLYGQLGSTTIVICGGVPCSTVPVQVAVLSGAMAMAGGYFHNLAVVPGILVRISIKPNATPPVPITLAGNGVVPVAILSTPAFNALASVDASSLTFGHTGDERSLRFCNASGQDVNGDGLLDLVCQFQTQLTGFRSGDTAGILKGRTMQSVPILGQEAIAVIP